MRTRLDTALKRPVQCCTAALSEGPKGSFMRRFVAGLLLGLASMYWYAYPKDTFFQAVGDLFAEASRDPNAKDNLDKMISKRR